MLDHRTPRRLVRGAPRIGRAAEQLIYIETQYFSSRAIANALLARMRQSERPRLQIVVILNDKPEAIKEEIAVGLRQAKLLTELAGAAQAVACSRKKQSQVELLELQFEATGHSPLLADIRRNVLIQLGRELFSLSSIIFRPSTSLSCRSWIPARSD